MLGEQKTNQEKYTVGILELLLCKGKQFTIFEAGTASWGMSKGKQCLILKASRTS